jgi:hypothetical protein
VSFLERAKQAAEQAKQAATETAGRAQAAITDPAAADKAKQALGRAKRGVATAIDRIDPAVLADVVIKATALQENANRALKAKSSPYRISQISIGAAIPPSVTFTITRNDDPEIDAVPHGAVASTELIAEAPAGTVRALDGSIIDPAQLEGEAEQQA